jgi:hypothetical protein
MPGYLAFDSEAIGSLRLAVQLALYELNAIVGRDSAAANARACTQRAARTAEAWVPLLQGLSGCNVLSAYSPVGMDGSNLEQAFMLQLAGGRNIVTDPLAAELALDLDAQARALAEILRSGDIEEFGDAKDKAWLRQELAAIEYSPSACKAFIDALGSDRFVELNNMLADQAKREPFALEHDLLPNGTPEILATLDSLGRVFGQFRAGATESELDSWDELLPTEVAPLALVRMVGAGIDIDEAWSDEAVQTALTTALWHIDTFDVAIGSNAIDVLAQRPLVAQHFLEETDEYLLERVLFNYDADARGRLLLASSDPSAFTPEQVRESMQRVIELLSDRPADRALVEYVAGGTAGPSWPAQLDNYFGPFLPELLKRPGLRTTLGDPPNGWADGVGEQNELGHFLTALAEHPTLFNQFEARAAAMIMGAQHLKDPRLQGNAAYVIGVLADVRAYQRTNDIETRASEVELGVAVLSFVTLGGIGTVVGVLDTAGATGAVLDRAGLDVRDAIAAGQSENDWLAVVMQRQALAAWAAHNGFTQPPALPAKPKTSEAGENGTQARDDYDLAVVDWLEAADASADPDERPSTIFVNVGGEIARADAAIVG